MKQYKYKCLYLRQPSDYAGAFKAEWVGWFDGDLKIANSEMKVLETLGLSGWRLCHKSAREMILALEVEE